MQEQRSLVEIVAEDFKKFSRKKTNEEKEESNQEEGCKEKDHQEEGDQAQVSPIVVSVPVCI